MSSYHVPVLVNDVIEGLRIRRGYRYIDATVGGGGHVREIVRRKGQILGIDEDREAIEEAGRVLAGTKEWKLVRGNFRDIERIGQENGFGKVEGILFDLGVSSHQLDSPARGFSWRFAEAQLDLRFDQREGNAAWKYLNSLSESELYEILVRFSEEELAGPIAHAIVGARRIATIATSGQLTAIVGQVVKVDKERIKTVTRILQALRIFVNDELGSLKQGLVGAGKLLVLGGRLVVISFHSLEDRIVKQFMRGKDWNLLTKKPILAGDEEIYNNSRARSAKLRIASKLS